MEDDFDPAFAYPPEVILNCVVYRIKNKRGRPPDAVCNENPTMKMTQKTKLP